MGPENGVGSGAPNAIRYRLSRARRQFQSLERSLDKYWEREPIAVVGEFNSNFTQYVCRLRIDEPPPLEWSVRFGEAIHNIRSALDQVIYELTLSHIGGVLDEAAFPIYTDPRRFQDEGQFKIRGISPDAKALVKSLQPYHAAQPERTILWYVHESWTKDKTQTVEMLVAQSASDSYLRVEPFDRNDKYAIVDGPRDDGETLATVELAEPRSDALVTLEPGLFIADEFSWKFDLDVTLAHQKAIDETSDIAERLLTLV